MTLGAIVTLGRLLAADTAATPSGDPTAQLLMEVLRVNTANPPGQEGKLAAMLAEKLKPLGFQIDIVPTPEPGKAHLIARLKGDGSKKPILLAAHADVVGVEREKWTVDPFAGVVKDDGYVYGRGAIDFKGGVAVFTRAVMMLAENKVPLARDVILLVEADEEGGRYNTSWLAQEHWNKLDCEFSLNEGGWIIKDAKTNKTKYVSISTADKSGVSMLLNAKGTSTHSSMPLPDNAIYRLSRAMTRLSEYDTQPFLIDSTRRFFRTLGKTADDPAMAKHFTNLADSRDPDLIEKAQLAIGRDPLLHAIMRNTIAPVLLNGGFRGNVIPGSATATINFRTVPGTDPDELRREIEKVINDPMVEVSLLGMRSGAGGMTGTPEVASPEQVKAMRERLMNSKPSREDTELFSTLVKQAKATYPGAEVTPYLFQAGTDAFPWRSRGIPVYGIYPYAITGEDLKRMHGNDERVPVASLKDGTQMIYNVLVDIAGRK